jgi:hypothetical protein
MKINNYDQELTVNGRQILKVRISQYYRTKHGKSIDDGLILELVMALDGETFLADSVSSGIEYFAADVTHEIQGHRKKFYRIIWIFEGEVFQVLGVVNAYRRKTRKKGTL